jgi:RND family efflux transporter MFP subunit
VLALLAVLAVAAVVVYQRGHARGAPSGVVEQPVVVAVVAVERGNVVRTEAYDGEFLAYQQIAVHPEVAGFLKTITVDEGDRVTQGQTLATLDVPGLNEDIARAQARHAHDQSMAATRKATAEQDHQTSQRLHGVAAQHADLIAVQDLDEATARDLASQGSWQAAISEEAESKAEVDKLLTFQADCRITAPFPGVVTRRFADPGALVQGGVAAGAQMTPLVTLSQIDVLRLSFPVTESAVPHIAVAQPITYRISAPGALGAVRHGEVSRFTRRLDDSTRTMEVQVDVRNPDFAITPGMYATITVEIDRHAAVLTLPHEAVRRRADTVIAYVVGPDHRIEERPITVGMESPTQLEILSGLTLGEQVVFGNLEKAKPGQLVEAKAMATHPGAP